MRALLFGIVLLFSIPDTAAGQDRCDSLRTAAASIRPSSESTDRAAWTRYLEQLRTARTCFKNQAPRNLYYDETEALDALGRYQEGIQIVDDFLARFAARPDSVWFRTMYSWRARLLISEGELAEAVRYYLQAFAWTPESYPDARAELSINIGYTFKQLKDFEPARQYHQRADSILRATQDSTQTLRRLHARALHSHADLLLEETDLSEGIDTTTYRQAARMLEQSVALYLGEGYQRLAAYALVALGEAFSFLGDTETAFLHLDHARRLVVDDPSFLALLSLKRGRLYTQVGAYDKAEQTLDESIALARGASDIDGERRALRIAGLLLELRGQPARAETYYREGIDVTEHYRESLRLTEWSAIAFGELNDPHRGLVRALLAQNRTEDAFLALEQTRARHLQDLLTQSQLLTELSPAERFHFDSLTTALVEARNRLTSDTLNAAMRNRWESKSYQLVAERAGVLDLDDAFETPSLDRLRQRLEKEGQVVLSYFIDAQTVSDALYGRSLQSYVFVLTPDTLAVAPLDVTDPVLQALLTEVSPLLTNPTTAPDFESRQFSLKALHELYKRLYAPVAPLIPEDARLIVIPDGPLFMLPFGMLVEAETAPFQYQKAPFLLKKHPSSVELATALLLRHRKPSAAPVYDVVAFGKTDFSDVEKPNAFRSGNADADSLINLPAIAEEINMIQRRFVKALIRLDHQATEASFFELAAKAKILHIASHTLLRASSPLHNAIVLSTGATEDGYDGLLYFHEIQRKQLGAQLVVLSGCSTAQGVLQPGEGMAGLQYAFRAMGVQSSLATSWFVDDNTTVLLMEAFYRNLQRGLPKDEALQQAQLSLLEDGKASSANPFLWAAPVLYGDTSTLALEGRAPLWLLWVALPFLLLFVLYLRLRSTRKR